MLEASCNPLRTDILRQDGIDVGAFPVLDIGCHRFYWFSADAIGRRKHHNLLFYGQCIRFGCRFRPRTKTASEAYTLPIEKQVVMLSAPDSVS